jgi:riboflavin synthase
VFTGIIEELGRVREIEKRGEDARIVIAARSVTAGSGDGDSISVNGVCLTALDVQPDSFAADVSKETLSRSTLGNLLSGSAVNLERAVTPATRLGGHIVQGHVDARGKFLGSESHGESWTFRIAYPKEIARYLVLKGSVAVEGISLTIANLTDDYFEIAVIPKTWELTNFSQLRTGDEVNLEVDIVAKYLERFLTVPAPGSESPASPATRTRPLQSAILFLGIILAMIAVNWFLFRLFGGKYFLWYLKNGPIISLATAFLGPTWTSLKARTGLISAHPAVYLGACMQILGVFFASLAPARSTQEQRPDDMAGELGLDRGLGKAFDDFLYVLLVLAMVVLSLTWMVFVAPLAYFVTLVAGVPARQALRGKITPTYVAEAKGKVALVGPPAVADLHTTSNLSFAQDPFAITQAASSLVLFIVQIIYNRFG